MSERASKIVLMLWKRSLLAGLVLLATLIQDWHWALDLVSHFQLQAFAVLVGSLCLAIALSSWKCIVSSTALLVWSSWMIFFLSKAEESDATPDVKVAMHNVLSSNQSYTAIVDQLKEVNADLIGLVELSYEGNSRLVPELKDLSHVVSWPTHGNFGMAMLSRWPIKESEVYMIGSYELPLISVVVETPKGLLACLLVHPIPPMSAKDSEENFTYLERATSLAADFSEDGLSVVVMGDFNTTPWSGAFKKFIERDMSRVQLSHPLAVSWGVSPIFLTGLSLDHILISKKMRVSEAFMGKKSGSDHAMIAASLSIQE